MVYEVIYKDKDGNVVKSVTFNAGGAIEAIMLIANTPTFLPPPEAVDVDTVKVVLGAGLAEGSTQFMSVSACSKLCSHILVFLYDPVVLLLQVLGLMLSGYLVFVQLHNIVLELLEFQIGVRDLLLPLLDRPFQLLQLVVKAC